MSRTLGELAESAEIALAGSPPELARRVAGAARRLLEGGIRASRPAAAFFVPGRIELLGKHVDYAGGTSLVLATEAGICLVATERGDSRLRLFDLHLDEPVECAVSPDAERMEGWAVYPSTVARRLAANFGPEGALAGADVAFESTLPLAAGVSSSSALVVATYLALAEVNDLSGRPLHRSAIPTREALGDYLGAVENGLDYGPLAGEVGVGTEGGCQDQTAILGAEEGRILRLGYRPVSRLGLLPAPPGQRWVVAASGVVAEKTGAALEAYNRASALARRATEAWRRASGSGAPHLGAALAESGGAEMRAALLREDPGGVLARRFEHFRLEVEEIVPAAAAALEKGDLRAFGELARRSQEGAEELLDNQVAETRALARLARECGAVASSAFGAGFGGSVWALVPTAAEEAFTRTWRERYAADFEASENARFFSTGAGPGARRLTLGLARRGA